MILLTILIVSGIAFIIFALAVQPLRKKSINGKHVVVIGGSSGIGKSVAKLAAREGAHVTIIARNVDRLEEAKQEIQQHVVDANQQIISRVSVDVADYASLDNNITQIEDQVGPIYMMVNCAGMAICGVIEDLTLQEIKQLIDVNYLGSIYSVKSILPRLKERKDGIVVLTGSQASLMGIYGFSIYSGCKFAVRGLAEAVHMEAKPYNVSVTLALPPDTDTPGFANENKNKPEETRIISEAGGLANPDDVAKRLLDDALVGKFFSYYGFESSVLTTLCVGMTPPLRCIEVIVQTLVLGPLRLLGCYYVTTFHKVVQNCYNDKKNRELEQDTQKVQ
ncbi:3-ketodihydrosphingosine reductase [Diabrotica virgifera virgifera]|uniref:3-dehydrosphinganine reductase n=1 Tax=Diabrotica virgifera virgifera TaxID=50390 RepID=A0ABM5LAZ7_DIAVI|nr:3-ketodihydrosphingosine reductase [Diabrotica virgifera virgifera]